MPTTKLTQVAVDNLKPPGAGRVEWWDSQLPGFGLRISAKRPGEEKPRKTWQVMYRVGGKKVRETLGTIAVIPKVDRARDLARASMQKAETGVHPVAERRDAQAEELRQVKAEEARRLDTLSDAIDRYLRNASRRMRPDYFKETKRTLDRDVTPVLGSRPIREITRRDVRELIEQIVDRGSPSHANHVLAYLRAMLNWAVANDLIETAPTDGLKMPSPKVERERVLNDDEIRLFWLGCDKIGWPFGPMFKLLLLTAQRRDELAHAPRAEFDLDAAVWSLPGARTKNGKKHLVHLSALAVDILKGLPKTSDSELLFTTTGRTPISGFGRARERLAAAMAELSDGARPGEGEVEPFTLHDLRRTAATGMAALRIAHHVLDKVLNHSSGKISGVGAIYNQFEYLDERKAALETWARHVEGLMRPTPANVVELSGSGRRRAGR